MVILTVSMFLTLAMIFILFRYSLLQKKEQENELLSDRLEAEKVYYEALSSQTEAIRRYRHDLAGHIRTVEYMLKKNRADELLPYLNHLQDEFQKVSQRKFCQNGIINSLIDSYADRYSKAEIPFDCRIIDEAVELLISAPSPVMSTVDACALLNNLLENAFEECERTKKSEDVQGWISLRIETEPHEIHIEVSNIIRKDHPMNFLTSKPSSREHGIGTQVIRHIVESCKGRIEDTFDKSNRKLSIQIYLPVPE